MGGRRSDWEKWEERYEGRSSGWGVKDSAQRDDVSAKEVRGAWHNANEDAVGTEYEGRSEKKGHADNN